MVEEIKRPPFGQLLWRCRRNCTDPDRGGQLTQERLAELLDVVAGVPGYSDVRVSNWERGEETIRHDRRDVLVGLIQVLVNCGGIATLIEANRLLAIGGYKRLEEDEISKIAPAWLQSDVKETNNMVFLPDFSADISTSIPMFGASFDTFPPPFMTPALPEQGVFGRDEFLRRICIALRLQDQGGNVPPLALRGMGGIGKTTLGIATGRLKLTREHFPDGVLWTELGPHPTVRLELDKWGRSLGIDLLPERDEEACRERLRSILFHRRVLLIVDDVWDVKQGRYFSTIGGPHCRTIITTRELDIAQNLATRQRTLRVDLLSPTASLDLLTHMVPEVANDIESALLLCERLEYLPLALTLAGRLLADEADVPSRMRRVTEELIERREARLQLLQAEGRLGLDEENPASLQAMLGLSVNRLGKADLERFAMAAVFGGAPLTWDINAAAYVWECTPEQAEETTSRFIRKGLVEYRDDRYWMHALLADYANELMVEMDL